MRKSRTNVVVTRSHRVALNLLTLFSKSSCRHDVPIRARVSFSEKGPTLEKSIYHTLEIDTYLDRYRHRGDPVDHPENVPIYRNRTYIGRSDPAGPESL